MPKIVDGATIQVVSDSFIHSTYSDDCLINASHLEKMRRAYTELHQSDDVSGLKLLVVFEGNIEISRDVAERFFNERVRRKKGEALVSNQRKAREYLYAASAVMKSSHPVEVFEQKKDALEWLNSL